jgi:polyphosphate kinase 2 (PPK2 family)
MFENVELGHRLDKETYRQRSEAVRLQLLDLEYRLVHERAFATLILINGVDKAGKGETMNLLNSWLDPRHLDSHGIDRPSSEEEERPYMWRFWRRLPPRGRIGVFFDNWYADIIEDRVAGRSKRSAFEASLERVRRFEEMLVAEGVLLLKLWFHISAKELKHRLEKLSKGERTSWRVRESDWRYLEHYDDYAQTAAAAIRHTSTGVVPWVLVDGADDRYRAVFVGETLAGAWQRKFETIERGEGGAPPLVLVPDLEERPNVVSALTLRQTMGKKEYERRLEELQGRLDTLVRDARFAKRSLVVLFEGMDAAGKGGAIRRVTAALDVRVVIFDRSWYGRVLVERVEGLCAPADWMRAYAEINDFEEQLIENGTVVVKFWLAIDLDEQLQRFRERESDPLKRHKITPEDWRNREKWPQYELAVSDMIERTSTEIAPWTLVEANNKYYARVKVLRTLCDRLEASL